MLAKRSVTFSQSRHQIGHLYCGNSGFEALIAHLCASAFYGLLDSFRRDDPEDHGHPGLEGGLRDAARYPTSDVIEVGRRAPDRLCCPFEQRFDDEVVEARGYYAEGSTFRS